MPEIAWHSRLRRAWLQGRCFIRGGRPHLVLSETVEARPFYLVNHPIFNVQRSQDGSTTASTATVTFQFGTMGFHKNADSRGDSVFPLPLNLIALIISYVRMEKPLSNCTYTDHL